MNRRLCGILLFALILGALSSPTRAASVSQLVSFDIFAAGAGDSVALDTLALDPFDAALGRLDEVRVSIDGNLVNTGSVFGLIPYNVNVGLDFTGLGGRFFDFGGSGLQFIHAGQFGYTSCSIAGCIPVLGPFVVPPVIFGLDFSFDRAFQEQTGLNQGFIDNFTFTGAAASPPAVITGAISAFERSPINLDLMDIVLLRTVSGQFGNLDTRVFGTMTLIYDYTPNPIPLPPAAWLFGSAVFGLAGYSRRNRRQRARAAVISAADPHW